MPYQTIETFHVPGLIDDAGKVAIHMVFGNGAVTNADRLRILDAVRCVVRSGYGFSPHGEIATADTAETAATRFRSTATGTR